MKGILHIASVIFMCMLFSTAGYAQHKIEIGLRVIPQYATFRYTTGIGTALDFLKITAPYYSRAATSQGIGLLYHPLKRISLGADLLYALQGGGYEQRKTNLNYLKLPLWVGYNSNPEKKLMFTLQSGLALCYLLSAKVKDQTGETIDIRQYVNTTGLGIPFAMGVKFKVKQFYFITVQGYLYSDITSISKTNSRFGVYNYTYPGLRIAIDKFI